MFLRSQINYFNFIYGEQRPFGSLKFDFKNKKETILKTSTVKQSALTKKTVLLMFKTKTNYQCGNCQPYNKFSAAAV